MPCYGLTAIVWLSTVENTDLLREKNTCRFGLINLKKILLTDLSCESRLRRGELGLAVAGGGAHHRSGRFSVVSRGRLLVSVPWTPAWRCVGLVGRL